MFSLAINRFFASTASSSLRVYRGMLIPKAPPKPATGFGSYLKSLKGTSPNLKEAAEKWKQMSNKEKDKYSNKEEYDKYQQ